MILVSAPYNLFPKTNWQLRNMQCVSLDTHSQNLPNKAYAFSAA